MYLILEYRLYIDVVELSALQREEPTRNITGALLVKVFKSEPDGDPGLCTVHTSACVHRGFRLITRTCGINPDFGSSLRRSVAPFS